MARPTQAYRFFTANAEDKYTGVTVRPFESDDTAIAYARTLLPRAFAIEIWRGEEFVERLTPGAQAA